MLKILRKKGVSRIVLWFLAVVIILAFGVFGTAYQMDSKSDNKPKYAGKLYGKKITYAEFDNQYNQTIISDILNYGINFKKIRHLLNQDRNQRTWTRILLLKEAEKRGLTISDEQLIHAIQTDPRFSIEKKFNKMYYDDILRNTLGITAKTFEECYRDKMKIDAIERQETAQIFVSDEEVKEAFRQYNEKIQVSYVFFTNDDFINQVIADDTEIQKFYTEHRNEFATPPMINVEYLRFDFAQMSKPDAQITQEERDATFDKAREVYLQLKDQTDFTEVAQQNNLTIETSGFFSMEQPNLKAGWPFELIQKIFAMEVHEITQPVETNQGYQILRIKESKDAAMPEYSEVQDNVIEAWKSQQAALLAKKAAQDIAEEILTLATNEQNFDFAKVVKGMHLDLTQTPFFGRTENYLPKLGPAPDFMQKAFALTKEKPISSVAQTAKGYCLIHLDQRTEADMTDFEKEKDKFANAILYDKKSKTINDFLTRLRLEANLESHIPDKK